MAYSFDGQKEIGDRAERQLDAYFGRYYAIFRANAAEQRRGIDRHFQCRTSGLWWSVEYKGDSRAARSGNAFIETVSVDTTGAPGWIRKSESQVLVYFVPPIQQAYVFFMPQLKLQLTNWIDRYGIKEIPNKGRGGDGYNTIGLLIPLASLAPFCHKEIKIPALREAS